MQKEVITLICAFSFESKRSRTVNVLKKRAALFAYALHGRRKPIEPTFEI
jgi:hypothetical protein